METTPPDTTAVVFAGGGTGDLPEPIGDAIATCPLRIAADSGGDAMFHVDVTPHVVIGDLDSISPAALAWARDAGASVVEYPVDKDATDLELALDYAIERSVRTIVLVGGTGGRLDHLLGNATLLASPRFTGITIIWESRDATARVCRPGEPCPVRGTVDDLVSLIPMGGDAGGVTTTGLRWRLDGHTLTTGTTLGISNRLERPQASISVATGTLLVIHERIHP